jgi:hypothetical protein
MSMSKEIITVVDELAKRFGIVIDWTSKNVVPYISELFDKFITYNIGVNCIPIVMLIFCFVGWYFYYKSYKNAYETEKNTLLWSFRYDEPTVYGTIAVIILAGVTIISVVYSIDSILNLIQLITFPELYVFEYIQNMKIGG